MKKGLTKSLLIAGLAYNLAGCNRRPEYDFKGIINGEKVEFKQDYTGFRFESRLTVISTNGVKTVYKDIQGQTLTVDFMKIYHSENSKNYTIFPNSSLGKNKRIVMSKIQGKFNNYLENILATNQVQILKELEASGIKIK